MSNNQAFKMVQEAKSFKFRPIPLHGKQPIMAQWNTVSDKQIDTVLTTHDGNIGILTGQRSNIIILDCDRPKNFKGRDGNEVWQDLIQKHYQMNANDLPTVIDRSGSGGYRYYFKWKQLDYNAKLLLNGSQTLIDVLHDGQCAVYPGSIYPGCATKKDQKNDRKFHKCLFENNQCQFIGKKYKWIHSPENYKIMDIPDWLEKIITKEAVTSLYKENKIKVEKIENTNKERITKYLSLLQPKDWDDLSYDNWRNIVWTLLAADVDEDEIHRLCALGVDKYNADSTDEVIKSWNPKIEWTTGPSSFIMKWIRSCLSKQGHSYEKISEMLLNVVDETLEDKIKRYLQNLNFKGYCDIYYDLYASQYIITVSGESQRFYIWSEAKKLWTHSTDNKMVSSQLYRHFSQFMEKTLKSCKFSSDTLVPEIMNHINKRLNFSELEGHLLFDCHNEEFLDKVKNPDPKYLAYSDKIINLETGEIRMRTKEDFYCNAIFISPSPKYSHIQKFINSLWNTDKERRYIQKLCGYFLTGEIKDRSIYIWVGKGRNGKSILTRLLFKVMCHLAVSASKKIMIDTNNSQNGPNPELCHIIGSRLAILSETKDGDRFNNEFIKTITGHDSMPVRGLYQEVKEFIPTMKLVMMTNHKPKFDSTDSAMVDRIKLLIFPNSFEHTTENTQYVETLISDYCDEMFAFMLDGARMYYKEGLEETENMKNAKKEYCKETNSLALFLSECCNSDATNPKKSRINRSLFKRLYKEYCYANRLEAKEYNWLIQNGHLKEHKFTNGVHVIGYTIKEDIDE